MQMFAQPTQANGGIRGILYSTPQYHKEPLKACISKLILNLEELLAYGLHI